MEDFLKYAIELAAAAVAAIVAIKVAVARMDERVESLRAEIARLESEHSKIETKLDKILDSFVSMQNQITRLATLIEKEQKHNGSR